MSKVQLQLFGNAWIQVFDCACCFAVYFEPLALKLAAAVLEAAKSSHLKYQSTIHDHYQIWLVTEISINIIISIVESVSILRVSGLSANGGITINSSTLHFQVEFVTFLGTFTIYLILNSCAIK